ncbi:MAG: hypothetical protein V4537_08170 [Pseudomonadota bacterium]
MQPEEFFITLMFGMAIGSAVTLLIQLYGRRKARQAVSAVDHNAQRNITLLSSENERQTGQIDRLQERLAVLERLAVDPAHRTAREIELLR